MPGIHCYVAGSIPAVTPRYCTKKREKCSLEHKKKKKKEKKLDCPVHCTNKSPGCFRGSHRSKMIAMPHRKNSGLPRNKRPRLLQSNEESHCKTSGFLQQNIWFATEQNGWTVTS